MRFRQLFILSLALCSSVFAPAQTQGDDAWDIALDRYERICNECIDLKARIAAGETVTRAEADGVMSELSRLRLQMSVENGQMSPAQRVRREYIARCFEQGRKTTDSAAGPAAGADTSSEMPSPEVEPSAPEAAVPPALESSDGAADAVSGAAQKKRRMMVTLLAGFNPFSFGGIFLETSGHYGFYVKAMTNFRSPSFSYSCDSDGVIVSSDGSREVFWAKPGSGARRSYFSAVVGPTFSPKPFFDVRLGVGYGWNRWLWTDSEGLSVLVSDRSLRTAAFDAGADFHWKMLSVSVGLETLCFKTFTPYIGAGINF